MDCCKTEIGNFPHNQDIDTGLFTDELGTHALEFSHINGTKFKLEVEVTDILISIIIPKGFINEDLFYCFTIKKPSGAFIVSAEDCPNFCLKTYIQTNPNCGNTCPPEV